MWLIRRAPIFLLSEIRDLENFKKEKIALTLFFSFMHIFIFRATSVKYPSNINIFLHVVFIYKNIFKNITESSYFVQDL